MHLVRSLHIADAAVRDAHRVRAAGRLCAAPQVEHCADARALLRRRPRAVVHVALELIRLLAQRGSELGPRL